MFETKICGKRKHREEYDDENDANPTEITSFWVDVEKKILDDMKKKYYDDLCHIDDKVHNLG